MMPFVYSNEIVFSLTLLIYLFAALIGIVCFVMSLSYKLKPLYVFPEVIASLSSIVLFCFFADGVKIRYRGENPANLAGSLCFMPLWSVILIALVVFVFVSVWLLLVTKKRLSSLTAMSIKEAIAELPTGLCFYDETGRILLLNEQIDEECKEITGESLYDGISFWLNMKNNNVMEGIAVTRNEDSLIVERKNGQVNHYKRIAHDFDGKTVYELSSTDISQEFALKREIERKNEELRKMNLRLLEYGKTVTEVTKEKEILATKVKVHSNLGSLILRTKKMLLRGEYNREALHSEWNDIMSLIFVSDEGDDKFLEAEKTASCVGVKIFYDGKRPPKGTPAERIFANAIFECVVNTARHADGDELYAKMRENGDEYSLVLLNNGKQPMGEVKEGGGLSSLRALAEKADGKMFIKSAPRFTLTIVIPKEAQTNE